MRHFYLGLTSLLQSCHTISMVLFADKAVAAGHGQEARIHTRESYPPYVSGLISWRNESEVNSHILSLMVKSGSGRQVYILHDDTTSGILTTIQTLNDLFTDVVVLRISKDLGLLEKIITSHYHTQEMRNMVIVCSKENSLIIFRKVSSRNLESPSIHWYVLMQEDYLQELTEELREGTQVTLALRTSKNAYQFMTSYINGQNNLTFESVGTWQGNPEDETPFYARKPLTPDLQDLYSDFEGRRLISAVVDNWPFFKVTAIDEVNVLPHSGIDFQVINSIAAKYNFTYSMIVPPDGGYGGIRPDGTITGMVGLVARREADFAIDEITITDLRESVVDFTTPYYLESTTIVSPAPEQLNKAGAIFSPFPLQVWLLLVVFVSLMGPLLVVVSWIMKSYLPEEPPCSLQLYSFNMFRSIVLQGNTIESKHWPHRYIFFFWYLFCFYIFALYSGTLTAVLAVPSFEKPIETLNDLLHFIEEKGYRLLLRKNTAPHFLFKEATFGIYKDIYDTFDESADLVPKSYVAFDRIKRGKFAHTTAQVSAEVRAIRTGRERFYIAHQSFFPQWYGIAMHTGSPYKKNFERVLMRLSEAGLIYKWKEIEMEKLRQEVKTTTVGDKRDSGPEAIGLVHLQAAFFLLSLGIALSSLIFGVEICLFFFPGERLLSPGHPQSNGFLEK